MHLPSAPSQVIEAYLLDKYGSVGPSLLPATPEARARAALVRRVHDLYLQPIQASCRRWGLPDRQRGLGASKRLHALGAGSGASPSCCASGCAVAGARSQLRRCSAAARLTCCAPCLPPLFFHSQTFPSQTAGLHV